MLSLQEVHWAQSLSADQFLFIRDVPPVYACGRRGLLKYCLSYEDP